ncbi:MAG: hypothetical protein DRJ52_07410 [Thermoprotei archaeon]|nr:MAG: hypothetical protein DRJ52_07410 [Thermoprotei archaeon]RLE99765.1 MAG: hypothetical protein DRJ63_04430 [Thermoprotei archaeon]
MKYGLFISFEDLQADLKNLVELSDKGLKLIQVNLPLLFTPEYYKDTRVKPRFMDKENIARIKKCIEEARSIGLKVFALIPVFKFEELFDYIELASVTLFNKRNIEWACPLSSEVRCKVEADIRNTIETYDVDGIVLNFMRYEGLSAGIENFFTCFCSECHKDAYERGYNLAFVRSDMMNFYRRLISLKLSEIRDLFTVSSLHDWLYSILDLRSLSDWISLHREVISEYLYYLTKMIKCIGGDSMLIGAIMMAPVWSILTGQDYRDFSILVDFIEPTLYFDWIVWEGLPVVKEISKKAGVGIESLTKLYLKVLGFEEKYFKTYTQLKEEGIDVDALRTIVLLCKKLNVAEKPLYAALSCNKVDFYNKYLEDRLSNRKVVSPHLVKKSISTVSEAGIETVVLYSYKGVKKYIKGLLKP